MSGPLSDSSDSAASTISEAGRAHLRLHLVPEVGPIRFGRLIAEFGSASAVMESSRAALQRVEGIGPKIADAILDPSRTGAVDDEIASARVAGVRIICRADAEYPVPLLQTPDPPICLYVVGRIIPTDAVSIAIVGTRRCSHYGREQTERFARMLAEAGFTIVSGLARGIDGHAHRAALQCGGRTLAVLGNGLPQIYPPEHADLAKEISQRGAVISETPMGLSPEPGNFPRRNRLIAGLSLGVLVMEAGERSGALTTARLASEYNREVFALPGRVDQPDLCAGVNALIRDGQAKLISRLEDVLSELSDVGRIMAPQLESTPSPIGANETNATDRFSSGDLGALRASSHTDASVHQLSVPRPLAPSAGFTDKERAVLEGLRGGQVEPETLAIAAGLSIGDTLAALTRLEILALVRREAGNRFHLSSYARSASPGGNRLPADDRS